MSNSRPPLKPFSALSNSNQQRFRAPSHLGLGLFCSLQVRVRLVALLPPPYIFHATLSPPPNVRFVNPKP